MARTMYDSTSVSDIPKDAKMIAAYADGRYTQTLTDALARKPKVQVVTITIDGTPNRHVADCENGLLTPDLAARWAKGEIDAGRKPTIYCSLSPWPTVRKAVADQGLAGKVSYWIAHYDGDPKIPHGAVAKQYMGDPGNSPGHYDVSSVADYWPGVDPKPKPKGRVFGVVMATAVRYATRRFNKRAAKGYRLTAIDAALTDDLVKAAKANRATK